MTARELVLETHSNGKAWNHFLYFMRHFLKKRLIQDVLFFVRGCRLFVGVGRVLYLKGAEDETWSF